VGRHRVFKRAYPIFRERGYRARLLAAAYRNNLHWTRLVGGDVSLTMRSPGSRSSTPAALSRSREWTSRRPRPGDDLLRRSLTSGEPTNRRHDASRIRVVRSVGANPARVHEVVPHSRAQSATCTCPTGFEVAKPVTEPRSVQNGKDLRNHK